MKSSEGTEKNLTMASAVLCDGEGGGDCGGRRWFRRALIAAVQKAAQTQLQHVMRIWIGEVIQRKKKPQAMAWSSMKQCFHGIYRFFLLSLALPVRFPNVQLSFAFIRLILRLLLPPRAYWFSRHGLFAGSHWHEKSPFINSFTSRIFSLWNAEVHDQRREINNKCHQI